MDIKKNLEDLNRKYNKSLKILGKSLLTQAGLNSSPRRLMYGAHLDQVVQIRHPEIPYFSTGFENVVGKHSDSYYKTESNYTVIKKIMKFPDFKDSPYILVVYNKDECQYDIIEKILIEDLTESYCYKYNTDNMDSLKEGDTISSDTVLYKSDNFDDFMNYRFGCNAYTGYYSFTETTEDSFLIREGFAKKLVSLESDVVKININDNDILINFYGDDKQYKSFPDIGEMIKDRVVCVSRRKDYNTILHDLCDLKLSKINTTIDTPYHSENGRIVDVIVRCNNDNPSQAKCDSQIMHYLNINKEYQREIYETLLPLIDENCSDDLKKKFSTAKKIIVDKKKWRDGDKKFSNIIIEFKIVYDSWVIRGNKLVGRYGNKGVVGTILPDDEMPFTEHGRVFDIICNPEGVIGRLNSGQLFEINLSCIGEQILRKVHGLPLELQADEIFKFMHFVNKEQCAYIKSRYNEFSDVQQTAWIGALHFKQAIPIELAPYWNEFGIDALAVLWKQFPYLRKYQCYVKVRGEYREMQHLMCGGWQYILKLKHTPKSKFSARSVSYVNGKNIPSKSKSLKNSKALYSTSPIRLGWSSAPLCRNTYRKLCELLESA